MRTLLQLTLMLLLLTLWRGVAGAQTPVTADKGTAVITGLIKLGENPAPNTTVLLQPNRQQRPGPVTETSLRAVTDDSGRYRLTGVPAGNYRVTPLTEVYVVNGGGKAVTVESGQTISQIDFALTRGGVMTGRVTDHDNRPMIAERLSLMQIDDSNQAQPFDGGRFGYETDDRGVYRIYGLPAGRYLISAGNDRGGPLRPGSRVRYARTFAPDVTDQSQAKILEVTAGSVIENVDIRFGEPLKTFTASGRAIDADSNQPVPLVSLSAMRGRGGLGPGGGGGGSGSLTNAGGEFQLTGLLAGRYTINVTPQFPAPGQSVDVTSDYYADPVSFEITEDNVSGLEVRVHRGASILGYVVVEGTADPAVTAGLARLTINATSRGNQSAGQSGRAMAGRPAFAQVAPDGSFRLSGLTPGQVSLNLNGFGGPGGNGSFTLLRIERNGAPLTGDFTVASGETVAGIRVVAGYGTGIINGRVTFTGATAGSARVMATAQPLGSGGQARTTGVNPNGQFRFEGLLPGNYEIRVTAFNPGQTSRMPQPAGGAGGRDRGRGGQSGGQSGGQTGAPNNQIKRPEVRQVVSVGNGIETPVNLTLDLSQQ